MTAKRTVLMLVIATALLLAAAGAASAHKTVYSTDDRIKFVWGHIGEPTYTWHKTGLDLGVYDNATGTPITGLVNTSGAHAAGAVGFEISIVHSDKELDITHELVGQFGLSGKYTYPIIYTEPGIYSLKIKGIINGSAIDQTLPPQHDIDSLAAIMWPEEQPLPDELAADITALNAEIAGLKADITGLKADIATLKVSGGGSSKASPIPETGLAAVLGLVATIALYRRKP
ncbi:MAG: hypothetical protein HY556_01540 [Euryarchaeota archaeon]|nr:hypothetical protein [Euryarchaeota archaeon]